MTPRQRAIKAADTRRAQAYIANLARIMHGAGADHVTRGTAWYREALREAHTLTQVSSLTTDRAAAIIAAVSPRLPWARNVAVARALVLAHRDGRPLPSLTLGRATRAAAALLHGADIDATLSGPKVRTFYRAIIGDTTAVTLDGHAINAARHGTVRVGISSIGRDTAAPGVRELRVIDRAYRATADAAGMTPRDLQATVWCIYREMRHG